MTDIEFKGFIRVRSGKGHYVIEAHWRGNQTHREVFLSSGGNKSSVYVFGALPKRDAYNVEGVKRLARMVDVLNLWITEHNEEELNTLLRLIEKGTTANLTAAENELVAHYLLNGGEPF